MFLGIAIATFIKILEYIIFADIILSWLPLIIGRPIRVSAIQDIAFTLYRFINKIFPTQFGGLEFAPLFVFILLEVCLYFLFTLGFNSLV